MSQPNGSSEKANMSKTKKFTSALAWVTSTAKKTKVALKLVCVGDAKEKVASASESKLIVSEKEKETTNQNINKTDEQILEVLCCPISLERMKQPTIVSPRGHTFEQSSIKMIHDQKGVCPLCNQKIESLAINYSIKDILTFTNSPSIPDSFVNPL